MKMLVEFVVKQTEQAATVKTTSNPFTKMMWNFIQEPYNKKLIERMCNYFTQDNNLNEVKSTLLNPETEKSFHNSYALAFSSLNAARNLADYTKKDKDNAIAVLYVMFASFIKKQNPDELIENTKTILKLARINLSRVEQEDTDKMLDMIVQYKL